MKKTTKTKKITPKNAVIDESSKCNCESSKGCDCTKENMYKKGFYVLVVLILGYFIYNTLIVKSGMDRLSKTTIPSVIKKLINSEKTEFKVENVKEVDGIYQFDVKIKAGANEQKYVSFITKTGKMFFTSGVEVDKLGIKNETEQKEAKKMTCKDIPKNNNPKLTAFVVADCPFGLQMQRLFKKASNELDQISQNLDIRYIGEIVDGKVTSMHGDKEAAENLRQICIREEQKNLFYPYLGCYMQEGKTDECLASTGVNMQGLKSCMDDKNKGQKYAKVDFDLSAKYNIASSPTLLLNEKDVVSEFDFGGRNVKAVKDILCCGADNKLAYCNQNASTENIATSLSKTDVSAGGSGAAANCGN